jgi:sugar phosphate isomerase/epimerase
MVQLDSVGLQLYSVREELAQDFEGTMRRIGAMGYTNVETARFANVTTKQAKALFDTLNMKVIAGHLPLPLGEMQNNVLDTAGILECEYLICAFLSADEYFQSVDAVKRACDMLNEAGAVAQENGYKFLYHNHWWEAGLLDGKPAYQHMAEFLDDSIGFEVDTYWMRTGGLNPVDVMNDLGSRAPLLHIKDGPANREEAMTAVGDGVMDLDAIFAASQAAWHIVELDRCDTDMMEAVEKSYQYLAGKLEK